MTEEIRRREGSISTLSFEQFIAVDAILGMKKYNNFMARLLMEDDEYAAEEGEPGISFVQLKKNDSTMIEPVLQKIREYQKIPREELREEKAVALLGEIEPFLYEVYKIMKNYGADDYKDLSFSPQ